MLETVREVDAEALSLSPKARGKFLTAFSTATAQQLFDRWSKLDKYLLVKYMDGNVKSEKADVLTFLDGDGRTGRTSWTTATAGTFPTRSSSPVTTRNGSAPWRRTTEKSSGS